MSKTNDELEQEINLLRRRFNSLAHNGGSFSFPTIAISAADTRTGAGAISTSAFYTALVTTGANALTLANGTKIGQTKKIRMLTDGGDGTLTPTSLLTYTTIVFNDVNDYVVLMWSGTKWVVIENFGCTLA